MKTPNENDSFSRLNDNEENEREIKLLIKDLNSNIIILTKQKESLMKYLYKYQKSIQLEIEENYCCFSYFYYIGLLISNNDSINFVYSPKYIFFVNNFFKKLEKAKRSKKEIIILIKIIYDLISNYELFKDNIDEIAGEDYESIQMIENIKKNIDDTYNRIYSEDVEFRVELNLPEYLDEINIKSIISKSIINLYKDINNFKNCTNINNLLQDLEIDDIVLEEYTIKEVKRMINSNIQKYLLTKEDIYNKEKIIALFYLLTRVLNNPNDLENFPFLSRTKSLLDEIYNNNRSLLSEFDKGYQDYLEESYKILKKHENKLSNNNTETSFSETSLYESSNSNKLILPIIVTEKEEAELLKNVKKELSKKVKDFDDKKELNIKKITAPNDFEDCLDLEMIIVFDNYKNGFKKLINDNYFYIKNNIGVSYINFCYGSPYYYLCIYNLESEKILKEFYGYPIIANLFSLIHLKDQIIVFLCRKKSKKSIENENNKNGFLIADINNLGECSFIETNEFSPSCICKIDYSDKLKPEDSYKDFLLVGGYDQNLKCGLINLFGVNYSNPIKLIKVDRVGKEYSENIDLIMQYGYGKIIVFSDNKISCYKIQNADDYIHNTTISSI